ncbi:MAG: EAL domain-containing protein [Hyphomicrobiales bacterium]|nr:EAL domain-containing protein [Hyphomicrobiales bacterium]
MLVIVFALALAAALAKMRNDAIEDAATNAGDMASLLAEQVEHGMEALDASLRSTVRTLEAAPPDEFRQRVSDPAFFRGLRSERLSLHHAALFAVADENGRIVAGSQFTGADISDRSYFTALRDHPDGKLVVDGPLTNRVTGETSIFLARRLDVDTKFRGVVFIAADPAALIETNTAITEMRGRTLALFMRTGEMVARRPTPAINGQVGKRMDLPEWHALLANGGQGGIFHTSGWFDHNAKYVAVRAIQNFPLVVDIAVTDDAALAAWRKRSAAILAIATVALVLILGLLYAQFYLRERLARARMRSWMRGLRLKTQTSELASVNRRFGLTLDYMSHGMAMFDAGGALLVSNNCYAELYGLDPAAIRPGMRVQEIFDLRIAAGAWAAESPEAYRRYALSPPFADRVDTLATGRIVLVRTKRSDEGGWVTMQEDVTDRMNATARLSHMALHDNLTQLPNRAAFRKHLAQTVNLGLEADQRAIVLLIDLDGFKLINDTYGHDIGDKVLVEVAARLDRVAANAFVARLGGDEFVFVARRRDCETNCNCAQELSTKLAREVSRPIELDDRRISVTLSIGAVLVGPGENDAASVLRRADLALLESKRRGRAQSCMFDEDMEKRFHERAFLVKELREALDRGDLEVFYQPIVAAGDHDIVSMEALLRWRHPTKGMISPAVFIPLAEESGLILPLGEWVLKRACADAAAWPARVSVAVNVSSLQIAQPNFADLVDDVLRETGLAPARLQIEITESVLLQNDRRTLAELHALHELGVTFALDDFGTGYASLAYLKVFPLSKVKIDKCFVDDICTNTQSIAIVGAVVALARGLGIATTAEGVETREQYETLSALGVMTMQGYYFGRPAPVSDCGFDAVGARAA